MVASQSRQQYYPEQVCIVEARWHVWRQTEPGHKLTGIVFFGYNKMGQSKRQRQRRGEGQAGAGGLSNLQALDRESRAQVQYGLDGQVGVEGWAPSGHSHSLQREAALGGSSMYTGGVLRSEVEEALHEVGDLAHRAERGRDEGAHEVVEQDCAEHDVAAEEPAHRAVDGVEEGQV